VTSVSVTYSILSFQGREVLAMGTEITKAVTAASNMAQYDEKSKRLLSQKSILAHILVKTVDEFKGMKPRDVEKYIEGEPYVGQVPVDPGLTNAAKEENGERETKHYRK
jgi:hypothetical protein